MQQNFGDVNAKVNDVAQNFFVFIEELTCEDFGYESIYTTKLCIEAARFYDAELEAKYSFDRKDVNLPQGCSVTDGGLEVNVAGGGPCKQDGYNGCFCHQSRWNPSLAYRGYDHYLHYKEGEANVIFWHNIPYSKGFQFVDTDPVAELREPPILYEPILDKRLCLLLRQSAKWDLWSAGPDTMPFPCKMNHETFLPIDEKKVSMFSPQYALTKDPDIQLAYAQNAFISEQGNMFLEETKEVLILDDCSWYPDQIRTKSIKHLNYDTYSLYYRKEDIKIVPDVFLSTQAWGAASYHFMLEELPRIIPWIDFLKDNPRMKIHQTGKNSQLIKNFLKLIGIKESRLIEGEYFARRVWTFRGTSCGFSQVYPSQLMNQYFRDLIEEEPQDESGIPVLFIIRQGHRQVKEEIRNRALNFFKESSVVKFDVMVYNESQSLTVLASMARRATIIFGGHGAGLSNIMWANPGTLLIELHLFDGDLRYPNLCYYWSAMTMGMKYYGVSYTHSDESSIDELFDFLNKEFSSE